MAAEVSDLRPVPSLLAMDRALEWYAAKLPSAHAQSVSGEQVTGLRDWLLGRAPGQPGAFETLITFAQAMYRLSRAYEGVPDCNVGDAITASGTTVPAVAEAPAWSWDADIDKEILAKLGLDELSRGIGRKQRDNREGWWAHAQKNRAFIEQTAGSCAGNRLAVVLGAGHAFDLPLLELARRFERLVLVDIDGEALAATTAAIFKDPGLRARVELRVMDVTGINRAMVTALETLLAAAGSAQDIERGLDRLCRSYRLGGTGLPLLAPGERADLLVSSCVLTQIALPQRAYARRLYEKRFGPIFPDSERTWILPWRELELRVQQDHINGLTPLAEAVVLTSDTIAHHTALDAAGSERPTSERILPLATESLLERIPKFLRVDRHAGWRWDIFRAERRNPKGTRMDVEGTALREA